MSLYTSMKVDFCTNNQPTKKYRTPTFMAKAIKVDWNSKPGKKIEQTLIWMGSITMAGIIKYKNNRDSINLTDEERKLCEEFIDFNEEDALNEAKSILEKSYTKTKDEKIMDKHWQLFVDAHKNKALLRGGYTELDDYTLTSSFMDSKVIQALNLLGKGVLEQAFSLNLQGFENFCENISDMLNYISNNNLELLKKKINPENSNEYKKLEVEIKKCKRKIGQLLDKENSTKRKELLEQIELLKNDNSKTKEIKKLKSQIQNLYKNCKNSEQISILMKDINDKNRKIKELLNQKVKLSPQEIINKVWTIATITASPYYDTNIVSLPIDYYNNKLQEFTSAGKKKENDETIIIDKDKILEIMGDDLEYYMGKNKIKLNKDINELIKLIQSPSPENNKAWNDVLNKKLYEYANIKYDKKYVDKIDLINCKYLNELIISNSDFWVYMSSLLKLIAIYLYDNPNSNIDEAIDNFINNQETKKIFESRKIDYNKWSHYDKNLVIESFVEIKAEDAKQKAVKNLCEDLTSKTFKNIPLKERKSLYKALNEIGIIINKNNIKINNRNIEFEDLDLIMSVIKTEFNNNFWSTENRNQIIDKARDTIYCHIMLLRKHEIDCAKKLKDSENVNIKVQKVDMSNIKHSLCLGNHSNCCTALGAQSNEWSAPLYIMNRCISAIEVLADEKPVGNTMIYLADVDQCGEKQLALVLDDIELQTKFQNNEKIKDMIIDFTKKLCTEIGQPNIPIYAGPGMHKIDMSNYPLNLSNMEIIGNTLDCAGIYLDYDGEQHSIGNKIEITDLYRIA